MPSNARIEQIIADQEEKDLETPSRVPFKAYDIPVMLLFVALFIIVFLQFFTRYALNDSIAWTEELSRYLLIALTFVGAIKCQIIQSHIRLDFIDAYFGKAVRFLQSFALLATTAFAGICCWSLWNLILRTSYQKMVSLPFPKYYLYAVILSALVILTLVSLTQFLKSLKGETK